MSKMSEKHIEQLQQRYGAWGNPTSPEDEREEAVADRFDLEQKMLQAWGITDDLKLYNGDDKEFIDGVIALYERRFEALWEVFEDMCAAKAFK